MRKHTANNVLKKTFEHLDRVLDEKKREADKRKIGQQAESCPSGNNKKIKEELIPVNRERGQDSF